MEWIIVDDFSNDDGSTRREIDSIIAESPLSIIPIYLDENCYGSKSTESGAAAASGQYVLILDQDDQLTDDALDVFSRLIASYEKSTDVAGVCARCINQHGDLIGTPFSWDVRLAREPEVRHGNRIRGELFQCTRIDIIRSYFKDMVPGYTNGWVWNRISKDYSYVYASDVVRIYDMGNPSSVSNLKRIKYIEAQFKQSTEYLSDNVRWLKKDKLFLLRMLLQWERIGIHRGSGFVRLCSLLPASFLPYITIVYPFALFKAKRDVVRGALQ